jgi:hypothetical protein
MNPPQRSNTTMMIKLALGSIVNYRLSEQDARQINEARHAAGRPGNTARAGQQFPAVVVRVWDHHSANLQVMLDGPDHYWATSRVYGEVEGAWEFATVQATTGAWA